MYLGVLGSARCLHLTTAGELPPLPQLSISSWSTLCDSCWRNHTEHWSGMTNTMHIQCSALLLCSGGPWLVVHYRGMAAPRGQCLKSCDHIGRWCLTWLVAHVRSLPLTLVASKCTQSKEQQSWESHDWVGRCGRWVASEKPSGSFSSFWSTPGEGESRDKNNLWHSCSQMYHAKQSISPWWSIYLVCELVIQDGVPSKTDHLSPYLWACKVKWDYSDSILSAGTEG